jgi:hypothetical protein
MSAQKPDFDPKPGDFGQLPIPGDNQIDVGVNLRRGENQSVRHPQRFDTRPKVGRRISNRNINRQDSGEQPAEEPRDLAFVVMPEPSPGHDLRIGDDRRQQPLSVNKPSDSRVSGNVESVLSIEKSDDDAGVENYRHSSRNPSTRSRNSPPVSRHPE